MAKFKFLGEVETIFSDLIHPNGQTVTAKPGEEVEVDKVKSDIAVLHPELEAVDDVAKKMVTVAEDKARVEASRVFGDAHDAAEVVEGASELVATATDAPKAEPAPAAPAAPAEPAKAPETPPAS